MSTTTTTTTIRKIAPPLFIILIGAFFVAPPAHAAQDALVSVDEAPIRERPDMDARIIETRKAGDRLRVSQFNKNGWYKTVTSSGQFGWIWQADLLLKAYESDVIGSSIEVQGQKHERRSQRKPPWLFLKAGGMIVALTSSDVSRRLRQSSTHIYPGFGGFGEIAMRVSERYRLAFRAGTYSASGAVTFRPVGGGTPTDYDVAHSGTPFLLGIDANVSDSESFQLASGLYLGLASNTTTVTADAPAPNSFSISSTEFALMLNFGARYWLSPRWALVGELAIYYSRVPKTQIPAAFNGDAPFRQSGGDLGSVIANHLGPTLNIGLQFTL